MSAENPLVRTPSIHSRLLIGLVIPLAIVAALVSIETFLHARKTSYQLHDQTLLSVMLVVSENVIASDGDLLSENILEALTENLGDQFFYHVAGPNDAFVVGYTGIPPITGKTPQSDTEPFFYDSTYQGEDVRAVRFRKLVSEQEINGWMTITAWQRVSERQNLALGLFTRSIVRMLVIVISAGIIVWIALSFGLQPLENLGRSIERRSPDDLNPIKMVPPIEVRNIVNSMNNLFGEVARANKLRERFIGDAAHQLRNPIAAIKTQSEAALCSENAEELRGSVGKILETTENTGRMVEQLLISARAHAQNPASSEAFSVEKVVRDVAQILAPTALQKGHEFVYEAGDASYPVQGYPRLFGEAIANLIDNAMRHTPADTQITVGLEPDEENSEVSVYVADEGGELGDAELRQLVEPFATGESLSQGSGLGLSVVDDIAKMHGGRLWARATRAGTGKELVITLPLSAP